MGLQKCMHMPQKQPYIDAGNKFSVAEISGTDMLCMAIAFNDLFYLYKTFGQK